MAAGGGEGEEVVEVAVENMEEEMEHGPGDSSVALMYKDVIVPDIYVVMDTDPANATLLPMPTALPPPPLGSCERRQCKFHAAEDVHQHRLSSSRRREAT